MTENPNRARDHLANERTFLAWVRTGVAIVVFGFAIGRFAVAIRQLTALQGHAIRTASVSVWMGVISMIGGAVLVVAGLIRYRATRMQIDEGNFSAGGIFDRPGGDFDSPVWDGAGGVFDLRGEEFRIGRRMREQLGKRAKRAIIVSQRTRHTARLAQIPRCTKNACSE